jgi:enoyl-CoA hydratase/carnithine racemase
MTGTDDAFCAGADLKSYMTQWPGASPEKVRVNVADGLGGLTRGLHRIPKPTIAAVNGWALAGGFETALACDIRIASERAKFGSFESRRGFHHGDGGIPRLVNSAGVSVAMYMLLTAEPISADLAFQWGLVAAVVPHDQLMSHAELVAKQIMRNDPVAVRSAKETILDMIGRDLEDQLRLEAINAYSVASRQSVPERLKRFYDKTDRGRYGTHETPLSED